MIQLIKACLIIEIIMLVVLFALLIVVWIWQFKKDKKHQEEKTRLKQSRDWHIKELKKRSENEDVDLH